MTEKEELKLKRKYKQYEKGWEEKETHYLSIMKWKERKREQSPYNYVVRPFQSSLEGTLQPSEEKNNWQYVFVSVIVIVFVFVFVIVLCDHLRIRIICLGEGAKKKN